MDLTDIKQKAETYIDWPSEKREIMTYSSAMLFAWSIKEDAVLELRNQIARLVWDERGKCASDGAARALAELIRNGKR